MNVLGETVPGLRVKLSLSDQSGRVIRHTTYANMTSMALESDHLGRVSFPVTLDDSVERLHVLIKTDDPNINPSEQAEGEHVLHSYTSKNGFIHISSKSKYSTSLAVGDTYNSPIVIRGPVSHEQIYAIVTNRGNIIYSEKISAERGIKIEMTSQMTPSIRLFVLGVLRSGELVSDSLKIDVFEDKCGLDLSIENDSKQILPGKRLNLLLKGTKGDSVALLGVDEAVYVLRNEDKLTKTKLMKELSKSDMGCGPGSSADLTINAHNSGLKVITSETQISDDSNDDYCLRREPLKRNKRNVGNSLVNVFQGFLRKCCLLGMWPTNRVGRPQSCKQRADILLTFMPDQTHCYDAFLQCCRFHTLPTVSASQAAS